MSPLPPVESSPLILLRFTKKVSSEVLLQDAIREQLEANDIIVLDRAVCGDDDGHHEDDDDDKEAAAVVFVLTSTERELEVEAEVMRLVKPTLAHKSYGHVSIMEEFTVENRDKFLTTKKDEDHGGGEIDDLFSSGDRIKMCYNLLETINVVNAGTEDNSLSRLLDEKKIEYRRHKDDDDGTMTSIRNLPTEAKGQNATHATLASTRPLLFTLEKYGLLESAVPVHTVKEREAILKDCWNPLTAPPIDGIRSYYGEEVAFYFAWLNSFTSWLWFPACAGVFIYCFRMYHGDTVSTCELTPFFGVSMFLWASFFVRFWDRQESRLAYKFGTFSTNNMSNYYQTRVDFEGVLRISPVTGLLEKYYDPNKRRFKYIVSAIITMFMVLCASFYMIVSLNLEGYIRPDHDNDRWTEDNVHPFHMPFFARLSEEGQLFDSNSFIRGTIPSILRAIVINYLNQKYRIMAQSLTRWENHETGIEHENSLILKRFAFESFDTYISLFYLAFFEKNIIKLRSELVTAFNIDTIRRMMLEMVIPMGLKWQTERSVKKAAGDSKKNDDTHGHHSDHAASSANTNILNESVLETYEEFDDYLEMVIQFGYITLFASAYPLAGAIALVGNWIELRVDATKMALVHARTRPVRTDSIGTWNSLLKVIVLLSALTNCLIFGMTSRQMMQFAPEFFFVDEHGHPKWVPGKGWIVVFAIFGIERVLLLCYALVQAVVPRVPEDVQEKVERAAYVKSQEARLERLRQKTEQK